MEKRLLFCTIASFVPVLLNDLNVFVRVYAQVTGNTALVASRSEMG